jgi:hypothetical protein
MKSSAVSADHRVGGPFRPECGCAGNPGDSGHAMAGQGVGGLAIALFAADKAGEITELTSMQTQKTRLAIAIAGAAIVAAALGAPARAAQPYGDAHHRAMRHSHYRVESSDVTVRKSVARDSGPDAFHGPAAIITAPLYIAGTFVSMPFRALEVVFPAHANDPRVLIGAPMHFVGQVATLPFATVNGAFGVRPTYSTYY